MKKLIFIFVILQLVLISPNQAFSEASPFSGKVISVSDGDTITLILDNNNQVKIRFSEIDAPENDQPYGQKSKKALNNLVFGKVVTAYPETTDRYGRIVARVLVGSIDVNLEMVKQGAAWAYIKYLTDNNILEAEKYARSRKVGIWALQEDQITPPWEWRHKIPQSKNQNFFLSTPSLTNNFVCSGKTRCKQMSSCEEAKFYLRNCHASKIDGDRDGVPCEALCK